MLLNLLLVDTHQVSPMNQLLLLSDTTNVVYSSEINKKSNINNEVRAHNSQITAHSELVELSSQPSPKGRRGVGVASAAN